MKGRPPTSLPQSTGLNRDAKCLRGRILSAMSTYYPSYPRQALNIPVWVLVIVIIKKKLAYMMTVNNVVNKIQEKSAGVHLDL